MTGEQYLRDKLNQALQTGELAQPGDVNIILEKPKMEEHGDMATNVAMLLAPRLRRSPRDIATALLQSLDLDSEIVTKIEVAGAGFINFTFGQSYYQKALLTILQEGAAFGNSSWGQGKRIQIEFVSANPTGPLNVVSARAAALGDVMANLLRAAGCAVEKEYYVNDAGRQIRLLGMSVSARYMALLGKTEPFPEEGYHGDYINDIARQILEEHGDSFAGLGTKERWQALAEMAREALLASQKEVLSDYGLNFDTWFRESTLRDTDEHLKVLKNLQARGYVYEADGAQWFRSTEFGDEKDRVLVTSEGEPTYFLVDVAYHANKYERGFEQLYDLWGPDHHGYIQRVKAALLGLGYPKDTFDVKLIQQVNLIRGGESVKMSKRAGKIIEMKELLDEVGVDVARYFFVARRSQSPLDFDMDLAKKTSDENPVYYVQYAHARICNIIRHAEESGIAFPRNAPLELLTDDAEISLIKKLVDFPNTVSKAAQQMEPHRIPTYLQELAGSFHRFYHHCRVVSDDRSLSEARLVLCKSTQIVLANGLALLGLSAPERM